MIELYGVGKRGQSIGVRTSLRLLRSLFRAFKPFFSGEEGQKEFEADEAIEIESKVIDCCF